MFSKINSSWNCYCTESLFLCRIIPPKLYKCLFMFKEFCQKSVFKLINSTNGRLIINATLNFKMFKQEHMPKLKNKFFTILIKNSAYFGHHRVGSCWACLQMTQHKCNHSLFFYSKKSFNFLSDPSAHYFFKKI